MPSMKRASVILIGVILIVNIADALGEVAYRTFATTSRHFFFIGALRYFVHGSRWGSVQEG